MLKFLISLLLLLEVNCAIGQQVTVNWGAMGKKDLYYYSFVKGADNDLIKISFDYKGRYAIPMLARYNGKLEEQASFVLPEDTKELKFNRLFGMKDHLYFFTNSYDKKLKSTTFYCQPLNIKTLQAAGENTNIGTFDALKKSEQTNMGYYLSRDTSKLLLLSLAPYDEDEPEKYHIGVYDHLMSKLWENTIQLPYKDKFIKILSTIVTNDGNVGLVIKHYDSETIKEKVRKDGKNAPSYKTKLLFYEKGKLEPQQFIIDIGDKFVNEITIAEESGDKISLFGTYQLTSRSYVNGYFLTSINKNTKAITLNSINPFPSELLSMIDNDKQGSDHEKDPGLSNFHIAKIVARNNGDMDYMIEQQIVRGIYTKINGSYKVDYVYFYGDIIDINVKKNGTHVIARIPKDQTAGHTQPLSVQALPYNDKLLLFYNDSRSNIERDMSLRPEKSYPESDKTAFAMTVIDANGNVSRTVVYENLQSKLVTATMICFPVGKNKIALYASKNNFVAGGKDMIGVLEVK